MKYRFWLFLIAAMITGVANAAEIEGKVTAIRGEDVTITLESNLVPSVGDRVEIRYVTPDNDVIPVGTWRVSKVDGRKVEAKLVESDSEPNIDMQAVIFSAGARKAAPKPTKSGKNGYIPSLNANVESLRFYESGPGSGRVPYGQREYNKRFPNSQSREINWELGLSYPPPGRPINFDINAVYYKPDGSVLNRITGKHRIKVDTGRSWHSLYGWKEPGKWQPGTYRVELSIAGQKVATGSFVITD